MTLLPNSIDKKAKPKLKTVEMKKWCAIVCRKRPKKAGLFEYPSFIGLLRRSLYQIADTALMLGHYNLRRYIPCHSVRRVVIISIKLI
jgi:hypothetical protein